MSRLSSKEEVHVRHNHLSPQNIPVKPISSVRVVFPVPLDLSWPNSSGSSRGTVNSVRPQRIHFSAAKIPAGLRKLSRYNIQRVFLIIMVPTLVTSPELKPISIVLARHSFPQTYTCTLGILREDHLF